MKDLTKINSITIKNNPISVKTVPNGYELVDTSHGFERPLLKAVELNHHDCILISGAAMAVPQIHMPQIMAIEDAVDYLDPELSSYRITGLTWAESVNAKELGIAGMINDQNRSLISNYLDNVQIYECWNDPDVAKGEVNHLISLVKKNVNLC